MSEAEFNLRKSHTVSSHVIHEGSNPVTYRARARSLDYERYLVGRPLQLFRAGIRAKTTFEFYRRNLYYFCEFLGKTTDQIVEDHGPFRKVKGKNRSNVEGVRELQRHVENYVLALQERVGRGEIKPSSCVATMPAVKLFCEMNDIILNWRKIGKLLPSTDLVADDEAYTRQQIQNMLRHCDLRSRIAVLFLASSGMRLGGLAGLVHGDLTPIYDKEKVIAVHARVYSGTTDAYDAFLTPEAWRTYIEYVGLREKCGEKLTKSSPVLLGRFTKRSLSEGKVKRIDGSTIYSLLAAVRIKAGINQRSTHYNQRYTIKTAHAFRKFFNTTLKNIRDKSGHTAIAFTSKERLLGHTLHHEHALEENYDRSDRIKELLEAYLMAVAELTMDDSSRLELQVKKLEGEVSAMKTVEHDIAQRDNEIRCIREEVARLERIVASLKEHIDNDLGPLAEAAIAEEVGKI